MDARWTATRPLLRIFYPSILVLLCAAAPVAESTDVSVKAADGFVLQGTFHPAAQGGPAILLLHQCNADRRIYDQLAAMLNVAGYNVLALDFRGFGGSRAGDYTDFAANRQRILERMPGDVDAALGFLTSQRTVNGRALGVVGGSCGVNHAIHAARRHPAIRTLVLLSGGTDAAGEAYLKESAKIPILGAASEEDAAAAEAIRRIVGLSANRESRVEMLKGAGHAASMFDKQPELQADIVIWFRSNLPPAGYGLPPAIK
ncbi:MAG: dienelactone hydrolase family protein [Vicinamibacterales bacterium]